MWYFIVCIFKNNQYSFINFLFEKSINILLVFLQMIFLQKKQKFMRQDKAVDFVVAVWFRFFEWSHHRRNYLNKMIEHFITYLLTLLTFYLTGKRALKKFGTNKTYKCNTWMKLQVKLYRCIHKTWHNFRINVAREPCDVMKIVSPVKFDFGQYPYGTLR